LLRKRVSWFEIEICQQGNAKLSSKDNKEDKIRELVAKELNKPSPNWQAIERATKSAVDTDPDQVRFTVDAGHIQRLGAELVGKQNTALSELVKNAFDADATTVNLTFSYQNEKGGTLVIADDGSGMSDEVIRDSWMRISTDSKIAEPTSPIFKRTRAGRKGIGRFSVQRLGKSLILETRPRSSSVGFKVQFDWDKDFSAGRDLSQVFSKINRFEKDPEEHGTKLSIFDLRDVWSDAAMERVWRSVLLLQPPFPLAKVKADEEETLADPGFSVVINGKASEQHRTEFSIESKFLSQAIANIEASVDAAGVASVRVFSPKLELDDSQNLDGDYSNIGPVNFSAHYFIYLPSTLSGTSVPTATEMGRTFGGIRIYRNGFRVLPYGERSDDWLELDRDTSRRELLIPAANLNFFGHVDLTTERNPEFEETSSREGLLENTAYQQLQLFSRNALEWAAKRVAAARKRKQTASQRNFIPQPKRPSKAIQGIISQLNRPGKPGASDGTAKANLEEVQRIAEAYEKQKEREKAEALEYQEMLRLLASLGLSISVFGHEVKGAREAVRARLDLLSQAIDSLDDEQIRGQLIEHFEPLTIATDRVFDVGGYIASLMSSTESRELSTHSVKGALTRFSNQFMEYMSKQNVTIETDVEPLNLRTTEMHASELDSVLLNLLTNSIKSMRLNHTKNRKVRIEGQKDGSYVLIAFEDNGGGVSPDIAERIFDAFYTTTASSSDDGIAGPGTGLGLKIVSDIAESYGGSIVLGEPSDGFNCRLEFRVLAAGK